MRALVLVSVLALVPVLAGACGDERPRERPASPSPPVAPDARMSDMVIDAMEEAVTDAPAAAAAPMEYEGVALEMTLDDLIARAAARGWRQNAQPGAADQRVTVFTTPDHPVKRYKLGFESGRIVNIEIDYRAADPARTALREQFAEARDREGVWYMTDAARTVLASVSPDGKQVKALHLARLRDAREGQALLRFAFGTLPSSGN